MPYIKEEDKTALANGTRLTKTAGQLNYSITLLLKAYLEDNGTNYQNMNDVMGALEGAKLEFVRRVVNPYEDQKIKENGDVY